MTTALADARTTVQGPTRRPRRFGLFSVANVLDSEDPHWIYGGLTTELEMCSSPLEGEIGCDPSAEKQGQSWYYEFAGDPWLNYMLETCKTPGRVTTASQATKDRFLAAEQSAVERGFQQHFLFGTDDLGTFGSVSEGIGALEAYGAKRYGGQIILHLPFLVAEEAGRGGAILREGDHLETVGGSLVSVGNYFADEHGGSLSAPVMYATGAVNLYRGPLVDVGPLVDRETNDYFVLVERAYGAIVDCFRARATADLCGCGSSGGGAGGQETAAPSDVIDLTGEQSLVGQSCTAVRNFANGRYQADPQTAWTPGQQADFNTADQGCPMFWDGVQWQPATPI